VLKIHLLGKLEIYKDEELLPSLETRKVEELLCYLLLFRGQTFSREAIADLLWGDINSEQSKNYFRKCLWQLQTRFDTYVESDPERLIITDSDWIQINPNVKLWLDIAGLEEIYLEVQGKAGQELLETDVEKILPVIEMYRGDLLEGWYNDWCLFERERFQYIYLALLDKLMDFFETQRQPELGIRFGNMILRYDRARERTHRRMMRLFYHAGDRTAALRQFEKCKKALRDELDVDPSNKTLNLYELLRTDTLGEANADLENNYPAQVMGEKLNMLVTVSANLIQVQRLLEVIQIKLEKELSVFHQELKNK
jgi:DNA-binding SARP family transcriptional activator